MKLTNLDYVQSILSSLGSDEVNSVSDTTESRQVLDILKMTYFNIISRAGLPEHDQLVQLDPSLDPDMPVLMYIPAGTSKIKWLKYFNSNNLSGGPEPGYEYVTILPIQQFLDMTSSFNPDETDVLSFTFTDNINGFPGNFTFYYKNDKQPQYCAILDDHYVIFDGYDAAVDTTLQSSKSMAEGTVVPAWSNADDFYPNIDESQVSLLLNEAKSLAFFELKQSPHPKAEQEAKRQWSSVQRDKSVINRPTYFDALPNFGRRGYANTSYFKSRGWDR